MRVTDFFSGINYRGIQPNSDDYEFTGKTGSRQKMFIPRSAIAKAADRFSGYRPRKGHQVDLQSIRKLTCIPVPVLEAFMDEWGRTGDRAKALRFAQKAQDRYSEYQSLHQRGYRIPVTLADWMRQQ